jgi:carboxyl-terminal processing protease
MKKLHLIIFTLVMVISNIQAQTKNQVNDLVTLAKTWGFLKYYHPEIATGKHNWDSVLVASTNRVLHAGHLYSEIDQMLAIAGQDTARLYKPVFQDTISSRNYDLTWISGNPNLTASQKAVLHDIASHPYHGVNYYASCNTGNDSTVFTPNEKPYPEMLLPNVNYRLLSLFRFWNVVNYFYPYKYAIGTPWDTVLKQFIPILIRANDTLSYHKALARMAASINDSHGGLWPQVYNSIAGKYGPSFNFRLIDGKAVVTRIADSVIMLNPTLSIGSVIETMDGMSIQEKIKAYWDYVPASNNGGKLRDMYSFILNSKIKTAVITGYQPNGQKFKTTITLNERNFVKEFRNFFEMSSQTTSKMLSDSVGYVYFSNINKSNLDSIMAPMMNTKAIIFDMRNYPENGAGTYLVPNYLLHQRTLYARNTSPDFSLPGMMKYKISNTGTGYERVGKDNKIAYQGKVILLVDERTQSAAEWACMALMTYDKVTVIGSQTAGADGNVTRTILPGGYRINFSGLGIYFPNGRGTQRTGIPIDIPVNYTVQDMVRKIDPVLNSALEFAQGNKHN